MKNITQLLFLFVLLIYSKIFGQIASWDFTGQNNVTSAAAATFDPNLNSSNLITRGTDAGSSTGANSFRTKGFKNDGISVSNNDYFQITLSASTGYQLSLSSIDASFNGTATFYAVPGVTSQFAYSINGSNFVFIGSSVTSASLLMDMINLSSISDLQNVPSGKIVTIRYYASGQTATGGWGFYSSSAGSSGLSIGGTVTAISPEKSAKSDIITFPGYAYPQNIDYKKYQADDIKCDSNSLEAAKFSIRDGGNSIDPDSFGTTLTSISFSISNYSNIKRIALYDGTNEVGTETNSASLIKFNGLNLTASDGSSKVFSIRLSFNTNVTDNQNLKFTIVSAKSDSAGSSFADSSAGGAWTDDTGNNNKIAVAADRLIFASSQFPASVFQNRNFSVRVSAVDINKNIDINASNSITLSRQDGDGQLSSTAGLTQNLVSGSYTWTDLQYNSDSPFSIRVSANNLSSAVSGSISVIKILSLNDILISQYSPHYSRKSDQYIVLFNNTDADIDLNGYEIAFSSAGGSSPEVKFFWAESKLIPSRKFRLLASNEFVTAGSISSKKADDIFPSFAEDSGQVALRFTNGGDVISAMAYGNVTEYKFGLSSSKKSIVSSTGGTYQLTVSGKSYVRTGDNNADYILKSSADISEIPNSYDSALNSASAIKSTSGELPKEFKLNQNYPNPFNPTTVISYQLTMLSHVQLKVYDLLGKEEATLVDEEKTPGYYTVLFNGQNCASGNYFYKITAGNIELVKKMTLIK
jgi:Secretion system C-terminal sorting domain